MAASMPVCRRPAGRFDRRIGFVEAASMFTAIGAALAGSTISAISPV